MPTGSRQTIRIALPSSGASLKVASVPGGSVVFDFNPSDATISREGNSLLLKTDNGGEVTIEDFFVVGDESLPQLVLPDGVTVAAADFFADSGMNLETAAGPGSSSAPGSGGSGEYADDAGSLIDGIGRLGSLGTQYWARSTTLPVESVSPDLPDPEIGIGPQAPGTPVPVDIPYTARAVLHAQDMMHNAPGSPNYAQYTVPVLKNDWQTGLGRSLTGGLTYAAGDGIDLVTATDSGYGWDIKLTQAGIDFLKNSGLDALELYFYVLDSAGNRHYIQVVIPKDGEFDSASYQSRYSSDDGYSTLVCGETHGGRIDNDTPGKDYNVSSTNMNDYMYYDGKVKDSLIETGDAADKAWGNDHVSVKGDMLDSTIRSGSGNDNITVSGSGNTVTDSVIDAGDGNNAIRVEGKLATGTTGGKIQTGSGDDTIRVGFIEGTAAANSTVDAGNGSNSITVDGSSSITNSVAYADIKGGTGKDTITVSNGSVTDSSITMGDGENTLNVKKGGITDSAVTGGDDKDTVTIAKNVTGSLIDAGDGENAVTVTQGRVDSSTITGGTDKDSFTVNGAVNGSTINTGTGAADTIVVTGEKLSDGLNTIAAGSAPHATETSYAVRNSNVIAEDGSILINNKASSPHTTAVLAQGNGKMVELMADEITLSLDKSSGGTLLAASDEGKTKVHGADELTFKAENAGSVRGMDATDKGENLVTGIAKVDFDFKSGMSYAMAAEDNDSKNTIEKATDVTFTSTTSSHGMSAKDGGANLIRETDNVTFNMSVGANTAMYAEGLNASNIIEDKTPASPETVVDINITGGSVAVYGMHAKDKGQNKAEVKSVDIDVTSSGSATGMHAETEGGNTVKGMVGVKAVADMSSYTAIGVSASNGGVNTLTGVGVTSLSASGYRAHAVLANSSVNAAQARNEIISAGNLTIAAVGGNEASALAARASNGGESHNSIKADNIHLDATGKTTARGMDADGQDARNTVQSNGGALDMRIDADATGTGIASGMYAANEGKNAINGGTGTADKLTIEAKAASLDFGNAAAMHALSNGKNSIVNVDTVTLTTKTTSAGQGINAYGGENEIINAKDIDIIVETGDRFATAINAVDGGYNSIHGENMDVTLSALSKAAQRGMVSGMAASGGGENTIIDDGNLKMNISASVENAVSSPQATGMDATAGKNSIHADGNLTLDITAGNENTTIGNGMRAGGTRGENIITSGGIMDVSITANGEDNHIKESLAMFASGGGLNRIESVSTSAQNDTIALDGTVFALSQSRDEAGNYIITKAGDDLVTITGSLMAGNWDHHVHDTPTSGGTNHISMGAGSDTLKIDGDVGVNTSITVNEEVYGAKNIIDMGYYTDQNMNAFANDTGKDSLTIGGNVTGKGDDVLPAETIVRFGKGEGIMHVGSGSGSGNLSFDDESSFTYEALGGKKTVEFDGHVQVRNNASATFNFDAEDTVAPSSPNDFTISANGGFNAQEFLDNSGQIYVTTNKTAARDDKLTINGNMTAVGNGALIDVNTWGGVDTVTINGDLSSYDFGGTVKAAINVDAGKDTGDMLTINGTVKARGRADVKLDTTDLLIDTKPVQNERSDSSVTAVTAASESNSEAAVTIDAAGTANIRANATGHSGGNATGILSQADQNGDAAVSVSAQAVEIQATAADNGTAYGVSATIGTTAAGADAANTIKADDIDIIVTGATGYGMAAKSNSATAASNSVSAKNTGVDLEITVNADKGAEGMYANNGENRVTDAKRVYINVDSSNNAIGMHAQGANGKNVITSDQNLNVTILADKENGSMSQQVYGMLADNGLNEITTTGNLDMTVTSTTDQLTWSYGIQTEGGKTLIHSDGDMTMTVTAKQTEDNSMATALGVIGGDSEISSTGKMNLTLTADVTGDPAYIAQGKVAMEACGGNNVIQSGVHDDKITLNGSMMGYLYNTTTQKGMNLIKTGAGADTVTINGDMSTNGVFNAYGNGGANAVYMGPGNDSFTLNGDLVTRKMMHNIGQYMENTIDMGYWKDETKTVLAGGTEENTLTIAGRIDMQGNSHSSDPSKKGGADTSNTHIRFGEGIGTFTVNKDLSAERASFTYEDLGGQKTLTFSNTDNNTHAISAQDGSRIKFLFDQGNAANATPNNFTIDASNGGINATNTPQTESATELEIATNLTHARDDLLTINGNISIANYTKASIKTGEGNDTLVINGNLTNYGGRSELGHGAELTVNTGQSAGDSLTVNGNVSSFSYGDTLLTSTAVTVDADASGEVTAASANTGRLGLSTLSIDAAGKADIKATSGDGANAHAAGIAAMAENINHAPVPGGDVLGKATVTVKGTDVEITATTGTGNGSIATGIQAASDHELEGIGQDYFPADTNRVAAQTTVTADDTLTVTAEGYHAYGMHASNLGARNNVTATDVVISATAQTGDAYGVAADVTPYRTNSIHYAGAQNTIDADGEFSLQVNAESNAYGLFSDLGFSLAPTNTVPFHGNTVTAGKVDIHVHSDSADAFGMYAGNSTATDPHNVAAHGNTIISGNVSIAASSNGGNAYAMYADEGGVNTITGTVDADSVELTGDTSANIGAGSFNAVSLGAGNDTVTLNGGMHSGLHLDGGTGTDELVFNLMDTNNNGTFDELQSLFGAANEIKGIENILVDASGNGGNPDAFDLGALLDAMSMQGKNLDNVKLDLTLDSSEGDSIDTSNLYANWSATGATANGYTEYRYDDPGLAGDELSFWIKVTTI